MSLELPGFYFDPDKNRYFPVSTRPAKKLEVNKPVQVTPNDGSGTYLKRRRSLWTVSEGLRLGHSWCQKERLRHQVLSTHLGAFSRVEEFRVVPFGYITAFCATTICDRDYGLVGDNEGWLYSYVSEDRDPSARELGWSREQYLNTDFHVSSISMSGTTCTATSSGTTCKIFVQNMISSDGVILDFGSHFVRDVWTTHLLDRNLVIGTSMKAICLNDLDRSQSVSLLETSSDVFAIHQERNLVYTGLRNGGIVCFDRLANKRYNIIRSDAIISAPKSSVVHLQVIHEWQLLISQADGTISMYDLRYHNSSHESHPLLSFHGHVGGFTQDPGIITVDPNEDYVFAAGADLQIRAWSLRTGERVRPSTEKSILSSPRNEGIVAMKLTEERTGLCLWTATKWDVKRYWIQT